jgi:hypothetical protein
VIKMSWVRCFKKSPFTLSLWSFFNRNTTNKQMQPQWKETFQVSEM